MVSACPAQPCARQRRQAARVFFYLSEHARRRIPRCRFRSAEGPTHSRPSRWLPSPIRHSPSALRRRHAPKKKTALGPIAIIVRGGKSGTPGPWLPATQLRHRIGRRARFFFGAMLTAKRRGATTDPRSIGKVSIRPLRLRSQLGGVV